MSGYSRGNPSMGDVLRSVFVLGAIVLGLWLVGQLVTNTPDEPTRSVDWQTAASGVEDRAGFVPLVPAELPKAWRATSARVVNDSWQLGVLTGQDKFIGLTQQATEVADLVKDRAAGSKPAGEVTIGGAKWQLRTGPGEDTTYARQIGDQAVVVTGSATRAQFEDYIASLQPYSG